MRVRLWLATASLMGLCSVIMGAFASHGLQDKLSVQGLAWIETGAKYQMYHALALLALVCLLSRAKSSSAVNFCGLAFTGGIVFFSGSLYWLAFDGPALLVYATPVGGVLLMLGWLAMFFVAIELDSATVK